MNTLQNFIAGADRSKTLLLSIDLDNTLVNRDLGSNWVYPPSVPLLKKILSLKNVKVLLNTGRETVGYFSFCRDVINLNNAILGSGAIILVNGHLHFSEDSQIQPDITNLFLQAVKLGHLAFIDFSHLGGRIIYFNQDKVRELKLKGLFYSQNPRDWFDLKLPDRIPMTEGAPVAPAKIFRIEFPVSARQNQIFYQKLINKSDDAVRELIKLLGEGVFSSANDYQLKRKVLFNDEYAGQYIFGRFEKNSRFTNKGIGLLNWLGQSKLPVESTAIIHVGDRDSGIIDDTLVKRHINNAFMIMVGNRSKANNPNVDLYLRESEDEALYNILRTVYETLRE